MRGQHHHTKVGYAFVHSAVDGFSRLAYSEVLPDEQAIACHGWRIRPALRGQVKHPMVQVEA